MAQSERVLTPDWILKETLSVQNKAIMDYVSDQTAKQQGDLTMTFLGCGTMGIAILGGILDSLSSNVSDTSSEEAKKEEPHPQRLPKRFNACVRSEGSKNRIERELGQYKSFVEGNVTIYQNENLEPVRKSDIVLLGCKPYMVSEILRSSEMQQALKGKLLISVCAGLTEEQLASCFTTSPNQPPCTIVRAMPNTAAAIRESMTVISSSPDSPLPKETTALLDWIFTRIGRVVHLPPAAMDASTALCGSGPAFCALVAEGLALGGVAMGIPRDDAYAMAAQTMRGTTGLLQKGEHPAILKDKVSTPGGCTVGGLLVLEESAVTGTMAKAVREATEVASRLGQGQKGVNGTRAT
ncbi:pyrroline-5-carboxylate reductase [Hortaea werneckii]|nr:pyrroline-5-carboxylate reductase [Hortaea werneckii]KAI7717345.1 pyrroline-5-carboxylate reductase [Hortaea werneckii]